MPFLVASLLRRWPLLVGLLLVAAGAGYATMAYVPPSYQATASVLLVPPQSQDDPGGNRLRALGGLTPARDILIQSLNPDTVRAQLTQGTKSTYAVTQAFTTSTPLLIIPAAGPTASSAVALRD